DLAFGLLSAASPVDLARRISFRPLLALVSLAIHRSWVEAALFQPALDLVFREAEVRFNPYVRNQSALGIAINRLAVNLQQGFEVFGCQHLRQGLEVSQHRAMVHGEALSMHYGETHSQNILR